MKRKKKNYRRLVRLELNFLLFEYRVYEIKKKNDLVIVFSFIFGIFYSNLFICMIRFEEEERNCSFRIF